MEIIGFVKSNAGQLLQALVLGLTGMTVGVAKLLKSDDVLTKRKIVGDMIISASLGMTAAGVLVFVPQIPLVAQLGIAAAFANVGLAGIKLLIERVTGGRFDVTGIVDKIESGTGKE